ncbi:hypothetical protein PUN28_005836 [Cardiocondyla obscurior]|uniref:Uncharacterized protein n=1 Tax=Cardiocondyla obscurior TaxID=286306 RepID=A0AAW2GAS7_9HYME
MVKEKAERTFTLFSRIIKFNKIKYNRSRCLFLFAHFFRCRRYYERTRDAKLQEKFLVKHNFLEHVSKLQSCPNIVMSLYGYNFYIFNFIFYTLRTHRS